eukprot:CAMPEP_0168454916 /NCGR_PEP_ID=MMETSP0228-20121227/50471_1 /TAXON_ID=133427 /ORGANISM="Protoceratium reticulatum, Strain CCCM 535 (=CCMP 1889)" /LENGTH=68 /DNA_ID=CAMNT_0008469725 /DNA_START=109 /DNA_END=312 /DNA_ORIENTATION=+
MRYPHSRHLTASLAFSSTSNPQLPQMYVTTAMAGAGAGSVCLATVSSFRGTTCCPDMALWGASSSALL